MWNCFTRSSWSEEIAASTGSFEVISTRHHHHRFCITRVPRQRAASLDREGGDHHLLRRPQDWRPRNDYCRRGGWTDLLRFDGGLHFLWKFLHFLISVVIRSCWDSGEVPGAQSGATSAGSRLSRGRLLFRSFPQTSPSCSLT